MADSSGTDGLIPCTYEDCDLFFRTEKEMKRHKKNAPEHDYCAVCNEDFEDDNALSMHKVVRPDMHNLACRVCGQEFKSNKGLQRHIELTHSVDQKLVCIGCEGKFPRASLLVEHLEFNHCRIITANEFMASITHKYLITELLNGGANFDRFMQKTSRYEAAVDNDDEGGINIMDEPDHEPVDLDFEVMKPHVPEGSNNFEKHLPYPPLPGQSSQAFNALAAKLNKATLEENERVAAGESSRQAVKTMWGGPTARKLFPQAASSTVAPSEYSVEQLDRQKESEYGINILDTRFWDPDCEAWNPQRFIDPVTLKYWCPFVCEQCFAIPPDLARHIKTDHKIREMSCPACMKKFNHTTALVAHCESPASKCRIKRAEDFSTFLDKLTGGFLGVTEAIRPDHLHNPQALITNPETGRVEVHTPHQAHYLRYEVTRPAQYKGPQRTVQIGGGRI
ncbi:hypothetical protein BU24DRAFT_482563 [Aaosphaeria arxii CBS 175.79]|uniref:C2H2-type domain-containing protein n=1 Tax=Aaosphaeria arxii CBS 175.79 TaxID=1450172 RepID=A0A6A5XQP3_9PLEO|nr:uncharacterized protein BU24DRAFT_482563 [Aaosphaeria arxii CBS 175.79]KAF2015050.1 hypothetical protein BU24DRAFT_482563 [Aaosphaeria arxii CBS 175.79]